MANFKKLGELINTNLTELLTNSSNTKSGGKTNGYSSGTYEPNQMLSLILDNMREGIVVIDTQFRYVYWNKGMEKFTNTPSAQVMGQVVWEKFSFLKGEIELAIKKALEGEATHNIELKFTLGEGVEGWTSESYFPLKDPEGNITGALGVIDEITREKRKEQLMQTLNSTSLAMEKAFTRDEIFLSISEKLKELRFGSMIFLLDEEHDKLRPAYMSFNKQLLNSVERMVGIKHENFPIDYKKIKEYHEAVINKQTSFITEEEQIQNFKRILPQPVKGFSRKIIQMLNIPRMIVTPLLVEEKVIGIFTIMSERLTPEDSSIVTSFSRLVGAGWNKAKLFEMAQKEILERKEAERAAIRSEERFRRLYEDLGDAVFVTTMGTPDRGRILEVNPATEKQTGYTREELIGMNVGEDIAVNEQPKMSLDEWDDRLKQGKKVTAVEKKRKKDGTEYWTEVVVTPIEYQGLPASLSINHDITERKRVEEELVSAKEKAEESDRLKSAFLANMSHEIRTPMNGILGFADLLREPELTGDEKLEYVSMIERSGKRMLSTINDLVNISKIEAGQMELKVSETNVNKQLEYLQAFFKPEAVQKGLEISVTKGLPDKQAAIQSDKEKLYAILTNLIRNAIKYTDEGFIEIGYQVRKEQLVFYVKDTGIGIPKDQQHLIFDRFVQADLTISKPYEGSGLGLSIAKAYLEMMGGEIWLESEEGKGSVFYFNIPYQRQVFNEKDPSFSTQMDERLFHEDLTVLIVEDDISSEKYLKALFKGMGKKILHAGSGEEAVELCRRNPDINLILMDIKMPGMDGYEAAHRIREFNRDVIIVAQTAYALQGDRDKALKAGCDDYLSKPIRKRDLVAKVNQYFG